jgi:PAS domain S-box-containing protein
MRLMEGQLTVPLHFAAEFLILAVAASGCLDAIRRIRSGGGWQAAAQAAGFAVLGTAQVMHGALVIRSDGAPVLLVLRTVAFLLVAAGAGMPSPMAAGPALFVAGPDATLALVPAAAAAVVAFRGFRAHRSDLDPASFAFTLAFTCFAAGEVATALAAPGGGNMLAGGHALRGLGALFLARWQWASIVRSVRLRFVAAFVSVLLLLVLVLSSALNVVLSRSLEREELNRLSEAGRATTAAFSETQATSAAQNATTFANTIKASIERGDPFPNPQQLLQIFSLDFLVFVGERGDPPARYVISSAQRTNPKGVPTTAPLERDEQVFIAGSDAVSDALGRGESAGIDTVGTSQMATMGVVPVVVGNRVRAVVVAGYRLDGQALGLRARPASAQLTLLGVGGRVVATTIDNITPEELGRSLAGGSGRVRQTVQEEGGVLQTTVGIAGARWFAAYVPVRNSRKVVIGSLVAARPSAVVGASQEDVNKTLFLMTLIASTVAAMLAWTAGRRFTRPIRSLTTAAEAVRAGDLGARAQVDAPDEVGALGEAFNEMTASLARMTGDLRSSAAQVQAIMQSMGDGLIATDREGAIVAFNRAAQAMTGVSIDRARGQKLAEVLRGTDAAGHPLADAAVTGEPIRDASIRRADGVRLSVSVTSTPLQDASGAETGRVIVVRDVSAEMQAERMKSEFLSNVSHELRTPLTPIKGYTEILRRKNFPREKAASFLDGILESTARLERIVEILVDFAAMEAGRLQPRTEPIPLKALVDEHLSGWRTRDSRHKFVAKVPAGLPSVMADRRLLSKCLEELLDNAVKFSPKGGAVEIHAEAVSNGGRSRKATRMRIDVTDHGIGISPEEMPSLFQDFRQLDGSETRQFGGLGLGLAYVKRVAVVHGGDVNAQSKPGRGSTFSLLLPLADTRTKGGDTSSKATMPGKAKRPIRPATSKRRRTR